VLFEVVKALAAMNQRRRPFAQKALSYAKTEPGPLPRNIDLKKMELDLDIYLKLRLIHREIRKLEETILDTLAVKGADSYAAACIIYNAYDVARGSNTPGIDSIYKDLNWHFKRDDYKENEQDPPE
jgi:hypothetical protein